MAPRAAIDANDEKREELRRQHHGERAREVGEVLHEIFSVFESQPVREVVRKRDQAEIEHHLGHASLVHEIDDDWRQPVLPDPHVGFVVDADAGEVSGKEHHRDQKEHGGRRCPTLVHVLDRDPNRATDRRQQPEHGHRTTLGEADGHEPMRRMIATALRRRAARQDP